MELFGTFKVILWYYQLNAVSVLMTPLYFIIFFRGFGLVLAVTGVK